MKRNSPTTAQISLLPGLDTVAPEAKPQAQHNLALSPNKTAAAEAANLAKTVEITSDTPPNSPMAAALNLARPMVCFDVETTGLDVVNDRIIEISCVKLMPNGERLVRTDRINPERPISKEATRVHGIADTDVANAPVFSTLAGDLAAFMANCDLTGFNLEGFDVPMLANEFKRCAITFPEPGVAIIDSWRIFLAKEPRDLSAAYRFYCGKTLVDAHSAEADAVAAADILMAQVQRYDDVPSTVPELDSFCHPAHPDWLDSRGKVVWRDGQAVLTFGKHRNQPLQTLVSEQPAYLKWILNADFAPEVLEIIRNALKGEFPQVPPELQNDLAEPTS